MPSEPSSTSTRPRGSVKLIAVLISVCVVLLGVAAWIYVAPRAAGPRLVRLATGSAGGVYLPLGQGIAQVVNDRLADSLRIEVVQTRGSADNMQRLESGDVDLAFVQNDTPSEAGNPAGVRTVTALYDEVLHILVQPPPPGEERIPDLFGLPGRLERPLAIGARGSGCESLMRRLLTHFGLDDDLETVALGAEDAARALAEGKIGGLCLVSGLRSQAAAELLGTRKAVLLPLTTIRPGSPIDALRIEHPYVSRAVIPARTYGIEPPEPVGSVAVQAVMVTRSELPEALVRDLTRTIFHHRVAIASRHVIGAQLRETFDETALRFPLHPGAQAYFSRDEPSFFIEYAEAMSLAFSVFIGLCSGLLALRAAIQRAKKNRIDVFYMELEELSKQSMRDLSLDELVQLKDQLIMVRRRAFHDLVAERLSADESFTIFQDFLRTQMNEVEGVLKYRRRELGLSDSGQFRMVT